MMRQYFHVDELPKIIGVKYRNEDWGKPYEAWVDWNGTEWRYHKCIGHDEVVVCCMSKRYYPADKWYIFGELTEEEKIEAMEC